MFASSALQVLTACSSHSSSQACDSHLLALMEDEKTPSDPLIEYDDLLDYDSLDLLEEDFKDIVNIRKLSDTAADKLTFTVFLFNVMITGFLLGYIPHYFYYWHVVKSCSLILLRWYLYKSKGWHYFLLDFCYYTNVLILIYFLSPWKPNILFPVIFVLSNGPLLWAIAVWGNSLVPHSLDKMTSVFIHFSPPAVTWALRWYSRPEQNFILCNNPTVPGPNGCNHVGWIELIVWPFIFYVIWMSLYIFTVIFWRGKKIAHRNYATSVSWLTETTKKTFQYKLMNIFGTKYRKYVYFIWQTVYIAISIGSGCLAYHWMEYGMIIVSLMLLLSCYKGSTFYIDVMAHDYYKNKETKNKNK